MSSSPGRILIVEDADEIRELLVMILQSAGYSVTACGGVVEAVALVHKERPDLIITDLMLGTSSGLDLITRIRSDLRPPIPPVIVCSGFVDFEGEALRRGAARFIPKPFDAATIQNAVDAVLSRRRWEEHERQDAAARSRLLRTQAVRAANEALRRLAPDERGIRTRGRWVTDFLPRYFGFGEAFHALVSEDGLRIWDSSREEVWKPGEALDLALCRDVMETNSALFVPNLSSLGADVRAPDGRPLRTFAGVPLTIGLIGVGALCFVDETHHLGTDGFTMLDTFGQRASAVLSDRERESPDLWAPSGLLSRAGLSAVLSAELVRSEREPVALGLFSMSGATPPALPGLRTAIGDLDEGRYVVSVGGGRGSCMRQTMLEVVEGMTRVDGFDGGGLIVFEEPLIPVIDAQQLLNGAEILLERARRAGRAFIERVIIRCEVNPRDLVS